MTPYETAADKWLEKPWNGYRIFDNIEHFINVEVLNDLHVIEYSEMEHPIVYVAECEYVSIVALINDVSFDVVSVYDHTLHTLNLLHQLQVVVLDVIDLILFLAEYNSLVLLIYNRDGHHHKVISFDGHSHGQVVEDATVWLEVVVNFH